MSEKGEWIVEYSRIALENATEIISYLRRFFTQNEIDAFYRSLQDFETNVRVFPTMYPESRKISIRRAILSKELSVYYAVGTSKITIVAIFDNRWDENRPMM